LHYHIEDIQLKYAAIVIAVIVVGILGFTTVKKVSPIGWGWWGTTSTTSGVALEGHDPVAYFENGAATLGDTDISYEYRDATWVFASEDNKNRFAENPEMYAPQFGGFCAFAVS
jgi:YHS domain-containing protein